jgi:hypothetical protein
MSIVMGRDPVAETLLDGPDASTRLAFPSICYMEALTAIRHELWIRESFGVELDRQVVQVTRNLISPHARSFLAHLAPCLESNSDLLNDLRDRFNQTLDRLSRKAEFIELNTQVIGSSLSARYVDDPTDNLIVCSIVDHAQTHPAETKAFLSGNTKDFGTEKVRKAFRDAGIDKVFAEAANALGWLKSPSNPEFPIFFQSLSSRSFPTDRT